MNCPYVKELSEGSAVKALSFTLSNTTRYLLTDEIEQHRLKGQGEDGGDKIVGEVNDGLHLFWQAEALVDFCEGFSFSFKHELGERPPFYLDSSKTTAALVYSF